MLNDGISCTVLCCVVFADSAVVSCVLVSWRCMHHELHQVQSGIPRASHAMSAWNCLSILSTSIARTNGCTAAGTMLKHWNRDVPHVMRYQSQLILRRHKEFHWVHLKLTAELLWVMLKMQEKPMTDMTVADESAGHDNARPDIFGRKCGGWQCRAGH